MRRSRSSFPEPVEGGPFPELVEGGPFPEPVEGPRSNPSLRQAQGTAGQGPAAQGTSAERSALERAAYGRTSTPADEARAADAARELHELELHEAAERAALDRAALDAADAHERRAHRIRSRVVRVSSVLAVLGLVAAGASMLLSPPASRDDKPFVDTMELGHREVAPLPTRVPAEAVTTGSAASAEHWFDAAQQNADFAPRTSQNIDAASTRSVTSTVEGWQVWVARDLQGNFCVIALEAASGVSGTACATPQDMTAAGIVMTTTGTTSLSVFWDGYDIDTDLV
ncbi:hypothetical protein [Agreia sp. Leaf283]|uniref:hypothetical protein n=1 Tax=Agreia sp. Leaf283 TaxID=1736321 RepID=UPI0006FD7F0C|nr:hypothetical protein [Agreia sp. Leaf283]KQP56761.1 hypothetical protein ASF51_02300 [Agreia sp. Leaf283]